MTFWGQKTRVQVLYLLLPGLISLGKLLASSSLSFPTCKMSAIKPSLSLPGPQRGPGMAVLACSLVLSRFSPVGLLVTLWTVAHQAPLSMGFSRQENEWAARPSCRGSSWPRDWTGISCTAGRFFTHWAICKACGSAWSRIMLCWGWLFQDQKKEVNRSHQFVMAVEMEMRREPSCPQRVCRWRR